MGDTKGIVDEGGIQLAAKVLAWFHGQLRGKWAAVEPRSTRLEAFVHAAQEVWKPAAVQLRRDNFETRKFLQDTGQD